jgi:hypothetical protein
VSARPDSPGPDVSKTMLFVPTKNEPTANATIENAS